MASVTNYNVGSGDRIASIKRVANNAIKTIWLAGIAAFLALVAYFIFYSGHAAIAGNGLVDKNKNLRRPVKEIAFSGKTTLVNIGLRMQAMPEEAELPASGSINIHKIIYDRKLNKNKKTPKPDFEIKAVPE